MDDDKATINVKAVSARAWERAKAGASKQGETMGAWISRAINQLADMEAGPREFPPSQQVNPSLEMVKPSAPAGSISPAELAAVMQGVAALAAATGSPPAKADLRRLYGLGDELVRDARGIPRRPKVVGKAGGQSLLENGKAAALTIEGAEKEGATPQEDHPPPKGRGRKRQG